MVLAQVKLWEPPYYDTEKKSPVEGNLNELAVTLMVIFYTTTYYPHFPASDD